MKNEIEHINTRLNQSGEIICKLEHGSFEITIQSMKKKNEKSEENLNILRDSSNKIISTS